MSRKDYIKIAEVLNLMYNTKYDDGEDMYCNFTLEDLIDVLSRIFKHDNERFDGKRFYNACTEKGGG